MSLSKQVGWSYPTSPNAERFKCKDGCWVVQTVDGRNPPKALAGYSDRNDAITHAERLEMPWCGLWLKFHPEVAAA